MPAPPSTVLQRAGVLAGPPRPGCCRICRAPVRAGYSTCTTCRRLGLALGRPLTAITPIGLVGPSSPLYRALRQYKSGEPEVARRQRARLAGILSEFADRCLTSLLSSTDLMVVVPSGDRRRPPPHPLVAVAEEAGLGEVAVGALRPGAEPIDHGRPSPLAYRAAGDVAGRAVVVLDDVYTTGAHLQSAAVALASAGARAVHPLVIGRYLSAAVSAQPHVPDPCDEACGRHPDRPRGPGGPPSAAHLPDHPPSRALHGEESVSAPRGMGMGKGGRHLTDRYSNPRPRSTGKHTVRDLLAGEGVPAQSPGRPAPAERSTAGT